MTDQEIKAERLRILDETAKFYNSNNRAVNENQSCMYKTEDNKRCAIGRLLTDEEIDPIILGHMNGRGVSMIIEENLLPERLTCLGIAFLIDLQGLHDVRRYWDESGLTQPGLNRYNMIKAQYC